MLKLPQKNSPIRELFDIEHLAQAADPAVRSKLFTMGEARRNARKVFESKNSPSAVTYFVLRANGDVNLVTFGKRGACTVRWNFGQ